jgi:translation initiation factor IF-2
MTRGVLGAQVLEGFIRRDVPKVRVKRQGEVLWEGRVTQLKQVKQVVDQVGKGSECGLLFDGFEDFRVGDSIEAVDFQVKRLQTKATDTGAVKIVA